VRIATWACYGVTRLLTGTFAYALAAAAGLTGLVAASETGFTVVRYAGAAYLVYLGVRKLLEREQPQASVRSVRSRLFLRGVLVQVLNPKIAVFFLAFLPQFVTPSRGDVPIQCAGTQTRSIAQDTRE